MPIKYCRNCKYLTYDKDYERNRCYWTKALVLDLYATCVKWEYYKRNGGVKEIGKDKQHRAK